MKVLFLIPARGGSKGFPRKNLALLTGIPLVGRAARTAVAAARALPDARVVCSTDDPAIAEAAREWGAETPFLRPADLATDDATTLDVAVHAVKALGGVFEAVVLVQATSPLTGPADLLGALARFRETGDPVASVCAANHPIEWYHRMDAQGRLTPVFPEADAHQRQLTAGAYRPNGSVHVASPAQLRGGGFWTPQTRGFVMPAERSVDVDCAADLEVARALLAAREVSCIEIAGRKIGPGQPCFIIAEAGVNHNGDVEMAKRLIDAAAAAGASAVKFQTFSAERLASATAPKAEYQVRRTGAAESQLDMLRRLELTEDAHEKLLAHCGRCGITFLSSPFDETSADFLETLGVPTFKIPSGEITNLPFLAHVARKGRPLIVSTGMSTLVEVNLAVGAVASCGNPGLILLHCVSNYPADPKDINLRAMETMRLAFGVPVGYSDHTEGDEIALAAVALGASVLEKHFTVDKSLPGPDHQASIEPAELAALVRRVRAVESSIGTGHKAPAPSEASTAVAARKSLVAGCDIEAGTVIDIGMVQARRPGTGLSPARVGDLIGRTAAVSIPAGTLLRWDMFK